MLFRPAFLAHHNTARPGRVLLARPLSFTVLTAASMAMAIGLITAFAQVSFHRKVQVSGLLMPQGGLLRVVSLQGGTIARAQVREGQRVHAGDTLFVVVSARATVAGGSTDRTVSELLRSRRDSLVSDRAQQQIQAAQRIAAVERKGDDIAHEMERVVGQIGLQGGRVALSLQSLQRTVDLQGANFVSAAQVQDRQADLLDQRQRLADLERIKASAARDMAQAQAEARDLRMQAQRDQQTATRTVSSIEQELAESEARREMVITAAGDGMLGSINAEVGQAVTAGQALASIIPMGADLQAELYVPSAAAGFIKSGMDVMLRYQAFPFQKFGQHHGRVVEISNTAMRAGELGMAASNGSDERLYRVRVELDEQSVVAFGTAQPLRAGMSMDASVVLEKRRLFEWALEPLLTVTGHL